MKSLSLLVFTCFCTFSPNASAHPVYTWNFASTPNSGLEPSYAYVSEGLSITPSGTSNLFYRATGGIVADETGLGLACCDDDHEVGRGQSITLNLSNLLSHHVTGITLVLDSIQNGETGRACDSPGFCAVISASPDANGVRIPNIFNDSKARNSGLLTIKAGSDDVLLKEAPVTSSVPEPGGLLLMGTGLVLVASRLRRKLGA